MGSSGSKATRSAAGAAARKYPSVPSPPRATPPTAPCPPAPLLSSKRDGFINLDASDPVYGSQLRSIGAVQPYPMLSNIPIASEAAPQASPANFFPDPRKNPAVTLLNRRKQLQEQAESEWEKVGHKEFGGRAFIDVGTIRQILTLRDQRNNKSPEEIERALGLRTGIVHRLGPRKVLEPV